MSYSNQGASYQDIGATKPQKYLLTAYLLAIFFGAIGVHRFYLDQARSGLIFLGLAAVGIGLLIPDFHPALTILGSVLLLAWFVAWVRDLFIMRRLVDGANGATASDGTTAE